MWLQLQRITQGYNPFIGLAFEKYIRLCVLQLSKHFSWCRSRKSHGASARQLFCFTVIFCKVKVTIRSVWGIQGKISKQEADGTVSGSKNPVPLKHVNTSYEIKPTNKGQMKKHTALQLEPPVQCPLISSHTNSNFRFLGFVFFSPPTVTVLSSWIFKWIQGMI